MIAPGLAPEMAAALRRNADLQPPGARDGLPIAEQRRIFAQTRRYWNEEPLPLASVEDRLAGGSSLLCRYYKPQRDAGAPLLIYLHGGGWVVGSLDTHDCVARALCHHGEMETVSIDYPLAPETAFSAIVDAIAATVLDLAAERPGAPIALCGDSAGAHLAVHAAARLMPALGARLVGLVSLYGVLAREDTLPSYTAFGDGRYGLSAERMASYWSQLGGTRQEVDPMSLAGPLPPAYLVAAECDILRDSTYLFLARLAGRGIPAVCTTEAGMAHAFMAYGRAVRRVESCALSVGRFLRGCV